MGDSLIHPDQSFLQLITDDLEETCMNIFDFSSCISKCPMVPLPQQIDAQQIDAQRINAQRIDGSPIQSVPTVFMHWTGSVDGVLLGGQFIEIGQSLMTSL